MSTIRVDNFGPSAGGTTYSARGIAKAWVNFNGTGTIAARDSENVSSLIDNTTGDYTVVYTSDFSAADYSVAGTAALLTTGSATPRIIAPVSQAGITTGNTQVRAADDTGTANDCAVVCVISHGDLA